MQENSSKKYPDIYYANDKDKLTKRRTRMKYVEVQPSRIVWRIGSHQLQGWRK